MNLQAEDKSNKALTVGALNVLGAINSEDITSIHTHLQTQDGVQSRIIADMEKLYQTISADGIITANEKQLLKKELIIIETEYPIIVSKAEAAKKTKADIDAYKTAFQKLHHYIYSELQLFNSMHDPLEIARDTFNAVFADYYSSRVLLQITQDGTTKFLPSLEISGDYENQIGTFQGRLYRWEGGTWILLNAVMPLTPVCAYNMADIHSEEKLFYTLPAPIFQNKKSEVWGNKLRLPKAHTYYHIKIHSQWAGDAQPILFVFRADWKVMPLHTPINDIQDFYVLIPPDGDYYTGIWMHGQASYQVQPEDSVTIHSLIITEIKMTTLIDSSGNMQHGFLNGGFETVKDATVGAALSFTKGCLFHGKKLTIKDSNISLPAKNDDWNNEKIDVLHFCKKGYAYTIQADFQVISGEPKCASIFYYDFTAKKLITRMDVPVVNGKCRAFITFMHNPEAGHDVQLLAYSGDAGSTKHIACEYTNFSLLEHAPVSYIGTGKQWTHSRWIKITDTNNASSLYYYGHRDYATVYKDTVFFSSYNQKGEIYGKHIDIKRFKDKWINLIVENSLQNNTIIKKIYIDGKRIETIQGSAEDFSTINHTGNADMGTNALDRCTFGALAHLLFFDRLLTEQEILYLYLNPQYPLKNYTLADWLISPDNPESAVKNLTPQYLGVTETVPTSRTVVITKGEKLGSQDANAGDWVLMSKTVGGWKVGVCYRWTGGIWINLEPEANYAEQYQACLLHICEIEELMKQTGHFGALFAKALVTQKALIDKLVSQEAFINKLAADQAFLRQLVVQQLKIDSDKNSHQDFEAWFDQVHGLKINNEGKELFKVDTAGNIFAKNAFLQDGTFTGEIHSGPLHLSPAQPAARVINLTTSQTAKDIYLKWGQCSYSVTDKGGNKNIVKFSVVVSSFTVPYFDDLVTRKVGERHCMMYVINVHTADSSTEQGDYAGYGETIKKVKTDGLWWGTIPDYDFSGVNRNLTKNYNLEILTGGKTFRLEDLPTQAPALKGCVWKDSSGFLRIT